MTEFRLHDAAAAFRDRVAACERIWVTVHESPDGDSIGAALALQQVLEKQAKQVAAIRQHPFPSQYERLPGAAGMHDVGRLSELFAPQMIVAMDIGSFKRVGPVQDWVRPDTDVVVIDHHPGSTGPDRPCRKLDLVDPSVASTTMLLYQLLQVAYPGSIGHDTATCLYIGLMTDTGCFRHSNTNAAVLQVAHELAMLGADAGALPESYMFRRRPQALRLLAAVLSSLEFAAGDRFASMLLTQDMLQTTGGRDDETEGFVNYASSLEGVQAAALLREAGPQSTRVSLRSSGHLDVGRLAQEFGGGGHRNAAGCSLDMNIATARRTITAAALRHLDVHQAAAKGA